MKVQHFAFVAALALSTPALAAPAFEDKSQSAATYSAATALYTQWVNAWTSVFDTTYGDDWISSNSATKAPSFSFIFGQFAATGTNFSQSFLWTSTTNVATYNMPVTAVPGPEAGAGLGALAMLGVAYWAKRRRDEQKLAA